MWADSVTAFRMSLKAKLLEVVKRPIRAAEKDEVSYFSNVRRLYMIYFVVDCDYDLYHNMVSNIQTAGWLSGTRLHVLPNNKVRRLPCSSFDVHMVIFNQCDYLLARLGAPNSAD